jgi:hypothetical protein
MVDRFEFAIDKAEVVTAEAHDMVADVELSEADEFADQSLAAKGELAPPFDFAARAHPPHPMVGVVPQVLEPLRHGPRRGRVEIGRRPLADRFMRPLLVVVAAERDPPARRLRRASARLRLSSGRLASIRPPLWSANVRNAQPTPSAKGRFLRPFIGPT